jgi:electron transfer flavoprotein alpha/beta subunit
VRWTRVFPPPVREGSAEIITADSVEEAAQKLADRLMEEKVI